MNARRILITGGAGFIGCNAARYFRKRGWEIVLWDNLSRSGGVSNLAWLRRQKDFEFRKIDVRDAVAVRVALRETPCDYVLHCAGQVAVTSSVSDPREDFEINLGGTFNLLEAVRLERPDVFFLYTCTNKVYGGMEETGITQRGGRWEYEDLPHGVSEEQPLDFHSPYGCSKGGADQYVRDYARIYGLRTVSFRQSCIYGERQFGIEDQGWVAWFTIAHALKRAVTIFGDGCQTRDVLFAQDLCEAFEAAFEHSGKTVGQVYNVGGGPRNQMSLLELIELLRVQRRYPLEYAFADWRPGDQRVFVADIRKAERDFGWRPRHSVAKGVERLAIWVDANLDEFRHL